MVNFKPMELVIAAYLVLSVIVGVVATYAVQMLMARFRVVDHPNQDRKHHTRPIVLGGGIACFLSFVIVLVLYLLLQPSDEIIMKNVVGMLLGGAVLVVGGLLDDKYSLKPSQQVIFPLIAVAVVVASGIGLHEITNPLTGGNLNLIQEKWEVLRFRGIPYFISWPADIITFVWILGMIYTTKFLDGVDGLVPGVTAIGAVFLLLVGLFLSQTMSPVLAVILLGVMLGFLVFNYSPASIFLGEGGSTWAGFMLATLAIISTAKISLTFLVMGLAILDTGWVIYRRVKKRNSPFKGDRNHLHLRLIDRGFTQRRVSLFYYLLAFLFGTAGLVLRNIAWIWLFLLLLITLILIGWFVPRKKKYDSS